MFGIGFLPKAPGTGGSLAAAAIWWWGLRYLDSVTVLLIVVGYALISWWAATRVEAAFGRKDASVIVSDEVAGMWLALLFVPLVWWWVVAALLLFRILDIAKPWPIGWFDRNVSGGLGVMADDIAAGLITGIALLVISFAV